MRRRDSTASPRRAGEREGGGREGGRERERERERGRANDVLFSSGRPNSLETLHDLRPLSDTQTFSHSPPASLEPSGGQGSSMLRERV